MYKKPNYVSVYNKSFYYLNWAKVDVHGVKKSKRLQYVQVSDFLKNPNAKI